MVPLTAITTTMLDTGALVRALDTTGIGAVTTFIGLVRDHNLGRRVLHLEYEAYEALAVKGLDRIVSESLEQWPSVRIAIHHRIGRMEIGDASVAIAAASPHRAGASAHPHHPHRGHHERVSPRRGRHAPALLCRAPPQDSGDSLVPR